MSAPLPQKRPDDRPLLRAIRELLRHLDTRPGSAVTLGEWDEVDRMVQAWEIRLEQPRRGAR